MDSNQTPLDQSVKEVMQTLPPVLRTYIAQERYVPVVKSLTSRFALHIDQAAVLERELILLLMGIDAPEEFVQTLAEEANLDLEVIKGITENINSQIFVPLREEEMRSANAPQSPPQPQMRKPVPAPSPTVVPGAPKVFAPPLQSPMYPGQPIPEPTITFKRPINPASVPSSTPVQPATPQPKQSSTPATTDPSQLLEDHEEPHIDIHTTQVPPMPARTSEPPPNLPGAMPPQPVPPTYQAPKTPAPPAPQAYNLDPYREPIDEQ